MAQRYPQYAPQITAAAKTAFLQGGRWAYLAGIVAVLLGAAPVFLLFPRRDAERRLLVGYHDTDLARPPLVPDRRAGASRTEPDCRAQQRRRIVED